MALSLLGFNPKLSLYVTSVVAILLVFLLFKFFPFVGRLTKTTARLVVSRILPGILAMVVGAKELILAVSRAVLLFNGKWIDKLSLRVHPIKNVETDERGEEEASKEFRLPEDDEILQQAKQSQKYRHQYNCDHHQQQNNEIVHIKNVTKDTDNGEHHQQPNNEILHIEHVIEDTLQQESNKPDLEFETKEDRDSELSNTAAENLEPEKTYIQEIKEEEEKTVDCKKFESLKQDLETQEENFAAQPQDPIDEDEIEQEYVGDEVFRRVSECTCPQKYTVWKEDGKYKFCNDRVSRMVVFHDGTASFRKGGGWQTIDEYLERKDPCRDTSRHHKISRQVPRQDSRRSSTSSLASEQSRLSSDLGPCTEPATERNESPISGRGQWERSQSVGGELDTRWSTRDVSAGTRPWRAQSSGIPVLNRNEAISARLRRASSVTGDNSSSPTNRRTSEPSNRQSLRFKRSASTVNSKDIFQCPPWRL